jgi:hypothetical protein
MDRIRNKLQALYERIMRKPPPIIQLLPLIFAFLGPGLVLWLIAFHIPVHYPQETMAPYAQTVVVASQ